VATTKKKTQAIPLSTEVEFDLGAVPRDKLEAALARLEAVKQQRVIENKLGSYEPYPKQREFHQAGASHRERLLMSGNRFGKTECGAAEMAMHLTGLYPDWWRGKVFDKPVRAWAAGVTGETTRDVLQAKLIGPPFREGEWGTGMIPKTLIGSTSSTSPATIPRCNSSRTNAVGRSGRVLRSRSYGSMKNRTRPYFPKV